MQTSALVLLVVPYLLIYGAGFPRWVGRAMGASLLIFGLTLGVFWFAFGSGAMIRPSGKLSQPRFENVRPFLERTIRVAVVVFGCFFAVYLTLPFTLDLVDLAAAHTPTTVSGQVVGTAGVFMGLRFLKESVYLETSGKPDARSYTLLYSFEAMCEGTLYELTVLPRSRVILDFRAVAQS